MIKNISTFGIVMMTALVVYRASTIDHSIELDGIYQRTADELFIDQNNDRLNTLTITRFSNEFLASNSKTARQENNRLQKYKPTPTASLNNVPTLALNDTARRFTDLAKTENTFEEPRVDQDNFSLDRESTINSNLSLLFPRQRILQHPSILGIGE